MFSLCAKFPGYLRGFFNFSLNFISFLALKFLNTYNLCTLAELQPVQQLLYLLEEFSLLVVTITAL